MRATRLVRSAATLVLSTAAVVATTVVTAAPATAHSDPDRIRELRIELSPSSAQPLIASKNVRQLSSNPGGTGISGCFQRSAPVFVMSDLDSIRVFDVTDAAHPELKGVLPSLQFENEAMNCGQRVTDTGTERFALVGVDLFQASPGDIQHTNAGGGELVIVDVTDPTQPAVRSRVAGTTSTHTVACVQETNCTYAYSAGNRGRFSIFDLRNLDRPVEVDASPTTAGIQSFASPTAGHKWNFDGAKVATHTGFGGSSMWDVSQPRQPRLITTTGAAGRGEDPANPGYNDFIHHNSFRPNARAFRAGAAPSFANGNVLLVTEEDYEQTDCSKAGSFQTWWVKRLDGTKDAIVPLDKVELSDLGNFPSPVGTFCSAHWFDYHPSGVVAVGYYGGGTQIVDVRKPRELRSYGYAVQGASEVWDSYWLPVYTRGGTMTAQKTNIVYSVDAIRGLDVYAVDVPGDGIGATPSTDRETGTFEPFTTVGGVLPVGLVFGAMALAVGVRRRQRRHEPSLHGTGEPNR